MPSLQLLAPEDSFNYAGDLKAPKASFFLQTLLFQTLSTRHSSRLP